MQFLSATMIPKMIPCPCHRCCPIRCKFCAMTNLVINIQPFQYCFMCGNGDELVMCDKCSRAICVGPDAQCLRPVNLEYKNVNVSFMCPPCHQDGDRKTKNPSPYYVCMFDTLTHLTTNVRLTTLKRASMLSQPLQIRPRLGHLGNLSMNLQLKFVAVHSSFHDQNF